MAGLVKDIVKFLLIVAALGLRVTGSAQNTVSSLLFDDYEWDFGTLREEDGKVSHVFEFTNTGSAPVVVERIKVDCGCTAVDYGREPVRPGEKGFVEIVFNPDRFSGKFSKGVTVYSGGGRNRNLLKVKGSVIGRPRSVEEEYPFALLGGLRTEAMHAALGYVENGSAKSAAIGIVNVSDAAVTISSRTESGSGRFKVAVPEVLEAGERALITLSYDLASGAPIYGVLGDRLYLSVNGRETELPLTLNAVAVDNFSDSDLSDSPRCEVAPVYHNFGDTVPGSELEYRVTISNKGRSDLVVRSVSSRRNTSCDLKEGMRIAPGGQTEVKLLMRVGREAYGTQTGGVSFVVNDPARPLREVRLGAEVY